MPKSQFKLCRKCQKRFPLCRFYKSKNGSYEPYCKECSTQRLSEKELDRKTKVRDYHRQWYRDNIEKRRAYNKKYQAENKEVLREKKRHYYQTHKEQHKKANDEWRQKNKEHVASVKAKWRANNKEKVVGYYKKYRMTRKENIRRANRKYEQKRYKNDPFYVFKERMSRNLYYVLKKKGFSKNGLVTIDILGGTPELVWKHLTNTYKINYGEEWSGQPYNIDHIIPVSVANTEEEVIKLYHYTNLQMLKPEDNREKSNSLEWKSPYQKKCNML